MSLSVKEFWKSVNISGCYGQEFGVLFFSETQQVVYSCASVFGKSSCFPASTLWQFLLAALARRIIKSVASVRLLVSTLSFEPPDLSSFIFYVLMGDCHGIVRMVTRSAWFQSSTDSSLSTITLIFGVSLLWNIATGSQCTVLITSCDNRSI